MLAARTGSRQQCAQNKVPPQHLLRLPLPYFQVRRVGDSVARVRELENIRAFLTGNALTVVLDLLF